MKAPTALLDASTDVSEKDYTVTMESLHAQINNTENDESGAVLNALVGDIKNGMADDDGGIEFSEGTVKSSLEEILLSLIALRSSDTHGKQLLDDLGTEFNTMLSPGTVYPKLHALCDEGTLEQHELIKTKEYRIDDEDDARAGLAAAAREHLALGMLFQATLENGEFGREGGLSL